MASDARSQPGSACARGGAAAANLPALDRTGESVYLGEQCRYEVGKLASAGCYWARGRRFGGGGAIAWRDGACEAWKWSREPVTNDLDGNNKQQSTSQFKSIEFSSTQQRRERAAEVGEGHEGILICRVTGRRLQVPWTGDVPGDPELGKWARMMMNRRAELCPPRNAPSLPPSACDRLPPRRADVLMLSGW